MQKVSAMKRGRANKKTRTFSGIVSSVQTFYQRAPLQPR